MGVGRGDRPGEPEGREHTRGRAELVGEIVFSRARALRERGFHRPAFFRSFIAVVFIVVFVCMFAQQTLLLILFLYFIVCV